MGDAAAVHRSLIPSAVQAVRPFLNADDSIAADSLAVLDSLGEYSVLSEDVVISLASSSIVSVRLRIVNILLKNLSMLRGELTMRVFLGLSTDIYPLMRKEAVDGVVELLKRDENWVDGWIAKCCYDRAVELLRDDDELVRPAAVRLVSNLIAFRFSHLVIYFDLLLLFTSIYLAFIMNRRVNVRGNLQCLKLEVEVN